MFLGDLISIHGVASGRPSAEQRSHFSREPAAVQPPAVWRQSRQVPWPTPARKLKSLQLSADADRIVVAEIVAEPSGERSILLRFITDRNVTHSIPLKAVAARFAKPIDDGCGNTIVFWQNDTSSGLDEGGIWHARFDGTRWSVPKILTVPRQVAWMPDHGQPIRLPECKVGLSVAAASMDGTFAYSLVVVDRQSVAVSPIVERALPLGDLLSRSNMLYFAYQSTVLDERQNAYRAIVTVLRSQNGGRSWRMVRIDTLPGLDVALTVDLAISRESIVIATVSWQGFSDNGTRLLTVRSLDTGTAQHYRTVASQIADFQFIASPCHSPTFVNPTYSPHSGPTFNFSMLTGSDWKVDSNGLAASTSFVVSSRIATAPFGVAIVSIANENENARAPMSAAVTLSRCNKAR